MFLVRAWKIGELEARRHAESRRVDEATVMDSDTNDNGNAREEDADVEGFKMPPFVRRLVMWYRV